MTEACHHDEGEDQLPAEWDGSPAVMFCVVCWADPAAALRELSRDLIGRNAVGPRLDQVPHAKIRMFLVTPEDIDFGDVPGDPDMHANGSGEGMGEWWFFPTDAIYEWDEAEADRLEAGSG